MNSPRMCYRSLVLMISLSMVLFGFQVKIVDTISVNGVIEEIDKNATSITVNQVKMSLSPRTAIVDQKGNPLKLDSLKQNTPLSVEANRTPEGYTIQKITIQTNKR
jgi:hypothetical protein